MVSAAGVGFIACLVVNSIVRILPEVRVATLVALAILSACYGLAELLRKPLPVPTRHWRVPRAWGAAGDKWFSVLFGFVLGMGFLTIVPFFGFYTLLVWSAFLANPTESAAALACFGAIRGLPVLLTARAISPRRAYFAGLPLAVLDGYAIADESLIRWLRIVSLLGASITMLTSLT